MATPLVLAAFGVCAVLAGAAIGGPTATDSASLTFKLEHFLCYSITPAGAFAKPTVAVVDQFRPRRKTKVADPTLLCNWARKNGSAIRDRRNHLLCYSTTSTQAFRTRRVLVTNQFKPPVRLAVVKPNGLCLPSGTSLKQGRVSLPTRLDHFQCYPVRPLSTVKSHTVGVQDEFGEVKYETGRPIRLCNPASKNGSRILNRRDHLLCYQAKPLQKTVTRKKVWVANQFSKGKPVPVTILAPQQLCLPSLKRELRPDLTAKIDQASLTVSCPGGGGTCITSFQFTVANAGTAPSGTYAVQATADPPTQTPTPAIPNQPSLAAGASTTLTATFGPNGNCFDPDCTVAVTVDAGNAVAESNETNNTDSFTKPG